MTLDFTTPAERIAREISYIQCAGLLLAETLSPERRAMALKALRQSAEFLLVEIAEAEAQDAK